MRITKTHADVAWSAAMRDWANTGCNVCPCCGETKTWAQCMKNGAYNKGITSFAVFSTEGFFRTRKIGRDIYRCYSCGAEWESEPYQLA